LRLSRAIRLSSYTTESGRHDQHTGRRGKLIAWHCRERRRRHMPIHRPGLSRRTLLRRLGGLALATTFPPPVLSAPDPRTRPIPSTGERLPMVGLGSWITFNVGGDPQLLDQCAAVIAHFVKAGGRLIDSSPMYGSSQDTIGYGLKKLGQPGVVFAADKIWTWSVDDGPAQIEPTGFQEQAPGGRVLLKPDICSAHYFAYYLHCPVLHVQEQDISF